MGSGRITSYIFTILMLLAISSEADAQFLKRANVRRAEKEIGRTNRKVKQPREVSKAVKAQKKQKARQKKQYNKAVKEDREHRISIQSSEVQERMKLDTKEIRIRNKERQKNEIKQARKSGRSKKYKRR